MRAEEKKDTEQLRKFVAENIKLKQFYEVAEGNASEQEMIREIYEYNLRCCVLSKRADND